MIEDVKIVCGSKEYVEKTILELLKKGYSTKGDCSVSVIIIKKVVDDPYEDGKMVIDSHELVYTQLMIFD